MSIYKMRRTSKVKQRELAQYLGVTPSAISRWESHKNEPTYAHIVEMCKLFGCTIDELMADDE